MTRTGPKKRGSGSHRWEFRARFRKGAFGWKSRPAIGRVKEAVKEIRGVARKDPLLGAEGAVLFLERVSPALENVDSSSGAIGTAVNRAIEALVPIIAEAPAEHATREKWLERLFTAHQNDKMPYIESLAEQWGELCASPEVASAWADHLLETTRMAFSQDRKPRGYFHGAPACLSALFFSGRFDELIELLQDETFWHHKQWAVKALAAMGRKAEAFRLAEACRGPWTPDGAVDRLCEEMLLSSGMREEAYTRYGLGANRRGTYIATFRAVSKKYPEIEPDRVLADLAARTPGEEGKWFAAAKDAGLYEAALALAGASPCDPRTLTRAARDFREAEPGFATGAGLLALHWLAEGYGYEITSLDVLEAVRQTLKAAQGPGQGAVAEARRRMEEMVSAQTADGFVRKLVQAELRISGERRESRS